MSDLMSDYPTELLNAAEGKTIFVGSACGEPDGLLDLMAGADFRKPPRILLGLSLTLADVLERQPNTQLRFGTWHPWRLDPAHIDAGRVEILPWAVSEVLRQLSRSSWVPDVAILQVSPPRHGRCSLGAEVGLVPTVSGLATEWWGLFNPEVPEIPQGGWAHADQFSRTWNVTQELVALGEEDDPVASDVATKIAGWVAGIAPPEPVLQIGLGKTPDAICRAFVGTGATPFGLLTDSGKALIESHESPPVACFGQAIGSLGLLSWLDENPHIRLLGANVTHSERWLRRIDGLVAINSALQIDLTGQIAAETVGSRQVSGPGGQLDFMLGAHRNPTGTSVIALPATAEGGKVSRVVASLTPGAVVTTPRTAVDVVVTENGMADLRGASLRQRRERLLAVADPAFQDELARGIPGSAMDSA